MTREKSLFKLKAEIIDKFEKKKKVHIRYVLILSTLYIYIFYNIHYTV